MANTLFFNGHQSRYPYWVNYGPNVPKYPSSQEMFRFESPDKFTRGGIGPRSYQNWTDKNYDFGERIKRQEHLPKVADRHEPCSRRWEYQPGTSAVDRWTKEGKDWPISDRFRVSGKPTTELVRARAINKALYPDEKFYPWSNYMTSTYRKPVHAVFGPLQKEPVYGVTHQHNRHGFMSFEDYY